jgi:hypothetical protein
MVEVRQAGMKVLVEVGTLKMVEPSKVVVLVFPCQFMGSFACI